MKDSELTHARSGQPEPDSATDIPRRVMNPPAGDYGNLHADEKSEVPANWVLAEPGTEIIERPVLVLTRETEDSYGYWWRSKKMTMDVDPELYKAVYVPPAR